MSLVRSADISAPPYGNVKLYSLNGSNDAAGLPNQLFSSDKHKRMYMQESYHSEYDPKYFLDSPSEELIHPSGVSGAQLTSYQANSKFDYLESQSTNTVDYDEEKVRLKLQELERALLLDDNDEMFSSDQQIEMDCEWSDPIQNVLLHDSPKESSSSADSNVTSISSSKEITSVPPCTPRQMLLDCANAIYEGNIEGATVMINELRQMVSIQGDPQQRIAAYMMEGLAARIAASGKFLYKALKCKEAPTLDRLSAMQILFEVCPCFRFGFMSANGAILEAIRDEKRVHIIDFDINQGSQYYTLIEALASQFASPPHVKLTGVDDPESVQRAIGGLNLIGKRLESLAEALGVPFEFQAVASNASMVSPAMLNCHPGEALIVNFAFQLHHMPDESVSTVNVRDQLLRLVKSLKPKLVTVVEQDVNTNTAPFLTRFAEAYNYYSAVFESLEATLPRESQDRMNVERQCLARDIVNIVACEGDERIERYEVAGKWRARMMMAGFTPCPMSSNVKDEIRNLIKRYSERFKMKDEMGALHFGWEEKNLIFASAWR
ncbi:Transcription factor GRAS [Dillenia turbinata]|uniref:Transcription factor GRAS n=1 Tax=Dillenia turbinata TaxID=194707 RepID=A0AAN8VYZ0_9MAGN